MDHKRLSAAPLLATATLAMSAMSAMIAVGPARAETPALVADLADADSGSYGGAPRSLYAAGGKLFFNATGVGIGYEPWVSDGTAAGTELLGDLCPGFCRSYAEAIGNTGGVLLFTALSRESLRSTVLYRTDGTRAGTFPLAPGGEQVVAGLPSLKWKHVFVGGRDFFWGCTAAEGCELWSSDGTEAGTRRVHDVEPGERSGGSNDIVAFGGKVYYLAQPVSGSELWQVAADGRQATRVVRLAGGAYALAAASGKLLFIGGVAGRGREIWGSDGTAAGTQPITDLPAPDALDRTPSLTVLSGRAYFTVDDPVQGAEIWASDGTAAGTRPITGFANSSPFAARIDNATGYYAPLQMVLLGNRLVFPAYGGQGSRTLWKSDGTPASTAPASNLAVADDVALTEVGGRVLFPARDGEGKLALWSSDGTPGGTVSLTAGCSCEAAGSGVVTLAGKAYFAAGPPERLTLWRTDGTRAGTRRFADVALPSPAYQIPLEVAALRDEVYFTAGLEDPYGFELWASDGRPGGERPVADLLSGNLGSDPSHLAALGDGVLFYGCAGGQKQQVWHSRGTAGSTVAVRSLLVDSCSSLPTAAAGGRFFFLEYERVSGPSLWTTDGTPGGTVELDHLESLDSVGLAPLGGLLYYLRGRDVWRSDGTPQGTRLAFTPPGSASFSSLRGLSTVGNQLYFTVDADVWASDGTQAGTRRLVQLSTYLSTPLKFVRLGATVYFATEPGPGTPAQVWASDGTPAGTRALDLAAAGLTYNSAADLVALNGALYLFARVEGEGLELWRTDGTAAGTARLAQLRSGYPRAYDLPEPVVAGNRLLFAADDGVHGRELWASDGTAGGTVLVRDVFPGPLGSRATALLALPGGRTLFGADDGVHGHELWGSDGTEAGTALVHDIAPGPLSSAPGELTLTAGRVFFAADDGLHGREPWSLALGGAGGCQPAETRLCLGGGRFAVEAEWKDFAGRRGAGRAVSLTADTGYFWFFDAANLEVILKVLDGRGLNDHFWVFYGALSSVEYTLTVTDTTNGLTQRYGNPGGQLASVADTTGFGPLGAHGSTKTAAASAVGPTGGPAVGPLRVSSRTEPAAATGVCTPAATRLCLGGRFAVEAAWEDFQGHQGAGQAVALTGDTGYFWFFDAANVEVVLKVLDGRAVNEHFWVFYGALSSVKYSLTVTDTETGAVTTYRNPSGRLASAADTRAF